MAARSKAGQLLAETARLNVDQVDLSGALRCTIGVLLPLVIGIAAGSVADGIAGAIGALCAGFASFQGAYRRRAGITVLVAAGMALATLSGALAAKADWSAICVVAVWALVAGMMTALSQASLLVGLQWCVAVIIVDAVAMTDAQALVRSCLVLAGGLVQTVLVVVVWPVRTYRFERSAIAAAYRDIADYARAVTKGTGLGMAPAALGDARQALADPQPLGREGRLVAFQGLVDEAERIRIGIVSLSNLRLSLQGHGGGAEELDELLVKTARVLDSIGSALLADAAPGEEAMRAAQGLSQQEEGRTEPPDIFASSGGDELPGWAGLQARRAVEALGGQLRSAVRLAEASAGNPRANMSESYAAPRPRRRSAEETWTTLRANVSFQSAVFRHAVRLAATLAAAMIIYRLSGLGHGYWIALTALLVLRQDFTTTVVRGLSRVAGTIVGAGFATLLVWAFAPGTIGLAIMFAAAAGLAFLIVRLNYALFSVCVTAYVVFLLALAGLPVTATAGERLECTLIGGALAIGAYLVWPTWQSRLVGSHLAELFESQASYADAVLGCYGEPSSDGRQHLGGLRSATRLARSNAETAVEQMGSEPARSRQDGPLSLDTARGLVAAGRRGSLALLTLHAHLPEPTASPLAGVGELTGLLVGRLRQSAGDLREMAPAQGPLRQVLSWHTARRPHHEQKDYSLRDAHGQLVEALGDVPPGDDLTIALLEAETDELVDTVNSVSELISSS